MDHKRKNNFLHTFASLCYIIVLGLSVSVVYFPSRVSGMGHSVPKRERLYIQHHFWEKKCLQLLPPLLKATGYPLPYVDLSKLGATLLPVVKFTQEKWLRNGGERWNSSFDQWRSLEKKLSLLLRQHFFLRNYPTYCKHDHWIIMGAKAENMVTRIKFVELLIKKGYKTSEIIFLTGDRPLSKDEITYLEQMKTKYNIETSGSILSENDIPNILIPWFKKTIQHIKVTQVSTLKQPATERATTYDTLIELKKHLNSKVNHDRLSLLIVSSNPYVLYQTVTAEAIFAQDPSTYLWSLDGAGEGCSRGKTKEQRVYKVGCALDAIARAVYCINVHQSHAHAGDVGG